MQNKYNYLKIMKSHIIYPGIVVEMRRDLIHPPEEWGDWCEIPYIHISSASHNFYARIKEIMKIVDYPVDEKGFFTACP